MESHGILTIHKCLNPGQEKVFEFLKLTAEPMVMENLKRSWKKSWNLRSSKEYKPCLWVATSGKNFSNDPNKMLKPFHANFKLAKSFQSMSLSESDLHGELDGAVEK